MNKIKAIIKRPDERHGHVSWISNSLENLQQAVGGYIEAVTLTAYSIAGKPIGLVVICDEEGRLKGKEYNCEIAGVDFVGEILLVGSDGDELTDCPIAWGEYKRVIDGAEL